MTRRSASGTSRALALSFCVPPPPVPRKLSPERARSLIIAQFPELSGLSCMLLGAGADHWVFELGGKYLFRFPKDPLAVGALQRELRLTEWLHQRLPLAIPLYRFVWQSSAHFARPFAGYEKLRGTPSIGVPLEPTELSAIGRTCGALLRTLHAQPSGEPALELPPDDDPTRAAWSRCALEDLRLASAQGMVAPTLVQLLRSRLEAPPRAAVERVCLVHGDFAAEHLLLDAQHRPIGLIDWSDAHLGDPAIDLAGFVHWGGEPMLSAALEAYGPVPPELLLRARWFALCRALADLTFGITQGRPEYLTAGTRALSWLTSAETSQER